MSAREVIAYAITHAPPGVKGGPYEAESGPPGEECDSLRDACRWPTTEADARECAIMFLEDHLSWCADARVIRIVRAGPSEASATLETARRRLAAVAESMTEHAYQEMASALEVDACRVEPSEASAVEVLRSFIAWVDCDDGEEEAPLRPIEDAARRVLAAAGPDPSEVVRAAMAWRDWGGEGAPWTGLVQAVDAYRKAGGK